MAYNVLHNNNREHNQQNEIFKDIFKPVLKIYYIFGQSYASNTMVKLFFSKLIFAVLLAYISLVFALAVFNRGEAIDIWIQFSLYIIPLLCFPVGAYIFGSSTYYRLMQRNTTSSVSVRFYLNRESPNEDTHAPGHNKEWLKVISIKSLIHPLLLEMLQWGAFGVFCQVHKKEHFIKDFVGKVHFLDRFSYLWEALYIVNWCITVYIVGFVSYQFVFVSRLIVKDTVHLMSLFGRTSYLQIYPVYDFRWKDRFLIKIFISLINFLTMDLFHSFFDEKIYSCCADITRKEQDNAPSILPSRVLHSPFHIGKRPVAKSHNSELEEAATDLDDRMNPAEACELFSIFIAEAESLTSIFVPFNIIITFFGIANLITHIGLFIKDQSVHSTYWTLFRTVLFLLVALRIIFAVQRVSSVLGKLPPHINLIKTAGKLGFDDDQRPNWDDFSELVASYNLGKRSFGFPMTMRQIASFVTVINMAFLIVFSIYTRGDKQ